ncbi:hypothetical protein [Streptomyces boluensis]|uniref:hypothetical protein n=1 Tax=Streptomyces boluensis TaxID=1775135 RepID=UPI0028A7BBAE|nr:hypothetical protein [Streptomyces boluensis]
MAWTLATGAAVTLSWWGVHTVMTGTAYDRPRALPITGAAENSPEASPRSSSTQRPRTTPKPSGPDGSGEDEGKGGTAGGDTSGGSPSGSAPGDGDTSDGGGGSDGSDADAKPSGDVKSYTVSGGRVAFEMGADSAELVSATPDSGWQMQVWKQPEWIRVTFTQGGREVSVFCTWHDHEPMVEIDDR